MSGLLSLTAGPPVMFAAVRPLTRADATVVGSWQEPGQKPRHPGAISQLHTTGPLSVTGQPSSRSGHHSFHTVPAV